jgi:sortase A
VAQAEAKPVVLPPKPSRWDRPPEPHDWRFVVGHLGRALITVGLMMFAFVGYQLWGTGIQEARSQDRLAKDFERAIQVTGPDASTTTAPSTSNSAVPVPTTVAGPPDQPFPHVIGEGEVVAALKIPKIDLSKYVVAGVGVHDLRKGVGHFPNTPFPGQLGNAAIAGHRTTYGQPFYSLDKLKPGDEIVVSTVLGGTYVYVVTSTEVVGKDDYHVITDSDPKKATLTLITCTPIGTASRRLVIHAEVDPTRSSPVGKAALYYGQPPPVGSDAATATLPDDGANSTTVPAATTVATSVSSASTSIPTATTVPTTPTTSVTLGGFTAPTDAFNQGWFSDSKAFVPVTVWGLILFAVWRLSYLLAKRKRRLWLGFVAGFVPFVFVAYFFFENVNRLLPTAI